MSLEVGLQKREEFSIRKLFKKVLAIREFTLIILIILSGAFLTFANPNFLTTSNIMVVIQGFAIDMIVAVFVCIALIGGHIDFSVGSTLGLCGIVTAMMLNSGLPTLLSVAGGLCAGVIAGLLNGIMITGLKITPLVGTIGTWMAYRGLTLVIGNGKTAGSLPKDFKAFGQGTLFGIPNTVIVMVIIVIVGLFVLKKIDFFHNAYYIGGNKESARLAGINVRKFVILIYALIGLMSALAGIVLASRLGNANVLSGTGLEFRLVVALLIGGVSFDGGEGSLIGAVLGVIMMGIVQNALVMLSVNPYWTNAVIGMILVFAVGVDSLSKQKRAGA